MVFVNRFNGILCYLNYKALFFIIIIDQEYWNGMERVVSIYQRLEWNEKNTKIKTL